ncbi:ribosome-binding protein [Ophidiomyces ophidiicola]|uniref:Ribosome-binding protein n=1 Tax=Ophidiomyces ophidiicola TaxID=1387563 RepID=A0ACB8V241_9EURO|nr:ribosome-binding protein [Ophidiomyces ophidiicola]KAI1912559.1 ribosome-binding protein [Ophidiomyces ophidiicola]KAI1918294.1 ribosome-binding protein [Ophidiomyces ophidiicola]KAI1927567.1 ribosome-binding protein [Ophidiomyces ophidiicola]KAI1940757.1 ribosome-binding protein [Ophidiomyces ophidiicola]KAI1951337.1 ribosome-binding protein [Ophidiomyces ophidiicola]
MSMDLDAPAPFQQVSFQPQQQAATILCCNCGAPIDGTTAAGALCEDCIKLTIDISQGIQREATLHMCKDCERWLQPPSQWVSASLESRELLALCLRKLRGLSKVRIVDASFLWTEPHSKRIKVKITIQQEAFQGTILQQTFEVEYVVASQQCPECAKSYTANTWRASVQVRQKVPHKRTFLHLEQLILKHGAHKDTINIKEVKDGLDFFFSQRNHAEKLVDFLSSVSPVRVKKSQQLISMDIHTSTKSYKISFSVELIPICKDDLVALPIKLARSLGNISPLTLCYRVGTSVNLLDPNTLQTADIPSPIYWRSPFKNLADIQHLVEFIVMDIEPIGQSSGRFYLAEATVARASDLGANDTTYFTRTHLGGVLHPGDSVMGYHLTGTNFNDENFEALEQNNTYSSTIPDVILVKKHYPRKKKHKSRNWRLKRLDREEEEPSSDRHQNSNRLEEDFETFLRDIEEDTELRSTLALYKSQQKMKTHADHMDGVEMNVDGDSDDDDIPKINMEELLDEFEELNMEDNQ